MISKICSTAVLFLAASLVAGCGSERVSSQEPSSSPTATGTITSSVQPSPTASFTASAPPTVPVWKPAKSRNLPPATGPKLEQSATAFVRRYVAAFNASIKSADKTQLLGYSSAQCAGCATFLARVEVLHQNKWRGQGDALALSGLKATQSGTTVYVQGTGHEKPLRMADQQGRAKLTSPETRHNYRFTLSWSGDRWIIDAIDHQ